MPYSIEMEDDVVHVRLTGRLTGLDLQKLCAEAVNYERQPVIPHRITDMRAVTEVAVHYPEIAAMAEKRRGIPFPHRFKSAIIADNPHHLVYARMFQTLNDNPHIAIRIFPDEPSASRWIDHRETR